MQLNMSTVELRKQLIEKIQATDNEMLLQEAYRLLDLESVDIDKYTLTDDQLAVVAEAKKEIKAGRFLTNDQANNEIDEWLDK